MAWADPKVELYSGPSVPAADWAILNQAVQELGVDLILPEEMGRDWKGIEESVLSIVRKLVDSQDGAAPIYVAITQSRGMEGGLLQFTQGPKLLTLSAGSLAAVEDDSQLALLIGHELKHPPSQIQELLDERRRRGSVRSRSILDRVKEDAYNTGLQKAVENEADVRSLLDKVHPKGYSPGHAVRIFDLLERQYGDAYSLSHPLILQRSSILQGAMTKLTRGDGEVLRAEPVHEVTNARWKAYFAGHEYRKSGSKQIQALLRPQALPKVEKALLDFKSGSMTEIRPNAGRFLLDEEVKARWARLYPLIIDRPLEERVRISEALNAQVIKDFLAAKNRILGAGYVPKSLAEAAYLLKIWTYDPRNQGVRGGRYDTTEELLLRLSKQINENEELIAQAKANPDAVGYQVSSRIEAARSELQKNRNLKEAIAKLYAPSREELEREIKRLQQEEKKWNWSAVAQMEAELRTKKKLISRLSKELEEEQQRTLNNYISKIEASIGKDDSLVNRLSDFQGDNQWMPRTSERFRRWWLGELPRRLARSLVGATSEEKAKLGVFLDNAWREQLDRMATQTEINQAFSDPEAISDLKILVQAMNEHRQRMGREGYVFEAGAGQENLRFDSDSAKLIYPESQRKLYQAGTPSPFEQRRASLVARIRTADSSKRMSELLDEFVSDQRRSISMEETSAWLLGIRNEMTSRYRALFPGIQAPEKVAEAVLDLKLGNAPYAGYQLGSKELFKRIREANVQAPLAYWKDVFIYRLRRPELSLDGVFEAIRESGKALAPETQRYDARDVLIPQKQIQMMREFVFWTARYDPKNVRNAVSILDNFQGSLGRHLEALKTRENSGKSLAAEVADLYRENGKVNWKRFADTGLIDPYYTRSQEFWETLSRGKSEQWLQDVLSFEESLDIPELAKRFEAHPGFIAGLRKAPLNDAFLRGGTAARATPEELQRLLLAAFSSQSDPFPERDELFQLFWKATESRQELRAPFSDERWVSRLMFNESRLALAKHQLASRYSDLKKGLGSREPRLVTNRLSAVKRSIEGQFLDPSLTRNELLDWVEKRLVSTPAEHRVLAPLWVNQENWVQMKGLALSDTLETISQGLSDNGERLDFVRFLTGRTKDLPPQLEKSLSIMFGEEKRIQEIKRLLPYLPSRFQALDRYERAAALHPFLAGKDGVLARPETLGEARKLVLGEFARDARFNAFFDAYMKHAPEHERSILMSYLLGQTGNGQRTPGQVLRDILEAMPPIGPRTGQELRSSGRASEAINQELNQLLDQAIPPTQKQIHTDIERIFGSHANRVRVGKLRGSGSVNYIIDIEIYDPVRKVWVPRVLKVQREKIAEHVRAEASNWRGAFSELKSHPDQEVRNMAQVAEESMEQAVSKLKSGEVELDARKEAKLYSQASDVYDGAQTRAVRPDDSAMRLVAQAEQARAGIYERIEGDSIAAIRDRAESARFAKAVLDQELGAIFQKGAFDTDPQLGNWLRERSTGQYVRLDYAQFESVDRNEVESFRRVIGALLDPKLKSSGAWIRDWASIMTPSVPEAILRREIDAILRGEKISSVSGLFERFTILRSELNERLSKSGHLPQTLRDSSRKAWTSLKKLAGIRGEYLADREFYEVLNRHIRLPLGTQLRLGKASGMSTSELLGSALNECQKRFKGLFKIRSSRYDGR